MEWTTDDFECLQIIDTVQKVRDEWKGDKWGEKTEKEREQYTEEGSEDAIVSKWWPS